MRSPSSRPGKPPAASPRPVKPPPAAELSGGAKTPPDTIGTSRITILEGIAADPNTSPQARIAAVRALMEARGELGKHQAAPGSDLAVRPLSEASRPELEAELARLRLHIAALRRA